MAFTVLGALRELDEPRHRAELYRAWGVGLSAGFTHLFSLEQVGRGGSRTTEDARRYLVVGLQQGRSIASLVKARPKLFAPFEAALLTVGEESGTLALSLRLLAEHYGRDYKRMLKVRSFMGYPIFLGIGASFAATIPFLQRGGMQAYLTAIGGAIAAFLLLGGVPISIFAGIVAGRARYALPRFARALEVGMASGLPLGRVVRLAVDVSQHAELIAHISKRSERQLSIMPLAALFEGCRGIPVELLGQMKVADATADYANTLGRYADGLEAGR